MEIELGAHVRTSDGQDVGRIAFLIVDPETGRARAAVIRRGFLLTDDIEIPLDAFALDQHGEARLWYTADRLRELPRFDESHYTAPPSDYVAAWGYPGAAGLLWPIGGVAGPAIPATDVPRPGADRSEADLANAVIDEGSDVISRDGDKVGEIHSIAVDTGSGRTISFVVRQGFLFTHDFELPGDTIQAVDDKAVYLSLTKDQLRDLTGRGA